MTDALSAWWRARTGRERALLTVLAVGLGLLAPLAALQAASAYRAQASVELAAAQRLAADVESLAAPTPEDAAAALPAHDGSIQGLAFSAAKVQGLAIARVEPLAWDGARIVFEGAPSLLVYRWFDVVARQGVQIQRSQITRTQAASAPTASLSLPQSQAGAPADLVSAEFELVRQ